MSEGKSERRAITRVDYSAQSVIVVCDTQEKIFADVINVSPLGIAVTLPKGSKSILGKDIIIVAETMIMYADVVREEMADNGRLTIGLNARKFTPDVLEYLFSHIADDESKEGE